MPKLSECECRDGCNIARVYRRYPAFLASREKDTALPFDRFCPPVDAITHEHAWAEECPIEPRCADQFLTLIMPFAYFDLVISCLQRGKFDDVLNAASPGGLKNIDILLHL